MVRIDQESLRRRSPQHTDRVGVPRRAAATSGPGLEPRQAKRESHEATRPSRRLNQSTDDGNDIGVVVRPVEQETGISGGT